MLSLEDEIACAKMTKNSKFEENVRTKKRIVFLDGLATTVTKKQEKQLMEKRKNNIIYSFLKRKVEYFLKLQ